MTTKKSADESFMDEALSLADEGAREGEIPVGCVIVKDGEVVGRGKNEVEKRRDPTAHAEITAIRKAAKKLKSWRLDGCDMFVTLEPCPMCAGAIVNARIRTLYYGAKEEKSGSAESRFTILSDSGLNHKTAFSGGILKAECEEILKTYFKCLRKEKNT